MNKKRLLGFLDKSALNRLASIVVEIRGEKSQKDFARELGVAQSTVSSWESGSNTPSLDNLEKLSQRLGKRPEELLAHLYGRSLEPSAIDQQIKGMSKKQLAQLLRHVVTRIENL